MKEFMLAYIGDIRDYIMEKLIRFSLLILVLFIFLYRCTSTFDITDGSHQVLSDGHWSVDGITLGDTFDQIVVAQEQQWRYPETPEMPGRYRIGSNQIHFDEQGKAVSVEGGGLYRNDHPVLQYGNYAIRMERELGDGYIVKKYRSTGTDMGAWMREFDHSEHHYNDNKKTKFVVITDKKDRIVKVSSSPIEDK